MKLYNTLTRSLEDSAPQDGKTVRLYTCGPTVYDYLHIGNWSAYIRWDLLARTLQAHDYDLNWIMNITDVGHLVSDADEGEDKLEKGAQREGKTAWQVAAFYTEDFLRGLDLLHISIDRRSIVKATDHIAEQIELIKQLETKGYTYAIDDGIYFDTSRFPRYAEFARLNTTGQAEGARVAINEQKRNPTDFALWKLSPVGQKRDMEWDSPWGRGFPGWHIECSAMAMKYLGETLDIHTGGIDHIPVHHTNEIAQSEAVTGKQFSRFWLHSNFMLVDNQKFAKSQRNGITLQDLQARGFSGADLRMLVLQSHYRNESSFTWEAMQAAANRLQHWREIVALRWQSDAQSAAGEITETLNTATKQLTAALGNDLDSPAALAIIDAALATLDQSTANFDRPALEAFVTRLDELLGFQLLITTPDIPASAKTLLAQRAEARQAKDWAASDRLRNELMAQNIGVRDTEHRQIWYWL